MGHCHGHATHCHNGANVAAAAAAIRMNRARQAAAQHHSQASSSHHHTTSHSHHSSPQTSNYAPTMFAPAAVPAKPAPVEADDLKKDWEEDAIVLSSPK